MGIPSFYRWLAERYPLSIVDVIEEAPDFVNGVRIPVDSSKANPNGVEFDNLYLDMNGIIHPCFHPEDQPQPSSYEEVYKAVFKYVDYIFSLIRPRKLLFMAIDGVAPRAKMNQQRSRRFRAAKDAADAASEAENHGEALDSFEQATRLDSNVITPGTEFMASLSLALRYYIHLRMNNDLGWRGIKVILSDASVPGEGEHKIAAYVRSQRNIPGFDPNTKHCLYGLDADLIMLALATHELLFSILREDVRVVHKYSNNNKHSDGYKQGLEVAIEDDIPQKKFQLLNIWVLREYLMYDLRAADAPTKIDVERLVDDFVFMCLFVGNDFLPHVPSLEISEGAIDLLMTIYKKEFTRMGGYLTDSYKVDLERVEYFLQVVGSFDDAIFKRRSQVHIERELRFGALSTMKHTHKRGNHNNGHKPRSCSTTSMNAVESTVVSSDKVTLGKDGWKERYYAEKFEAKTDEQHDYFKNDAVAKYVEGICWVMHYYYQGVCSWQWFYPYHYAPFASDFIRLQHLDIHFELGVPFKPFDQLMAVLPAASAHALPLFYRNLMTNSSSSIADFYPPDFEFDLNGKRHAWQAVCKLPFIEETRLLAEIKKVEHTLTDTEKERNSLGSDTLFLHIYHPLALKVVSFQERKKDHPKLLVAKLKKKIDPKLSGGMNGYIYISDKTIHAKKIYSPIGGMDIIRKNETIFVYYKCPPMQVHISRLPEGVILPEKLISRRDLQPTRVLWHEKMADRRHMYSIGPVPKTITGPCLSMMAHQLVREYYIHKTFQTSVCGLNEQTSDAEKKKRTATCKGVGTEIGIYAENVSDTKGSCDGGTLGKRKREGPDQEIGETVKEDLRHGTVVWPECESVEGEVYQESYLKGTRKRDRQHYHKEIKTDQSSQDDTSEVVDQGPSHDGNNPNRIPVNGNHYGGHKVRRISKYKKKRN